VAEKPGGGSWGVVRYVPPSPTLPTTEKVEGDYPAFFDGWFAQQDDALLVCQIAPKYDPLFAAKNDPFDGAETGGAEAHIAEQSRSWRAASGERAVMRGS